MIVIEAQMSDATQTFDAGMTLDDYMADLRVHRDDFTEHYERLAGIVDELRNDPPLPNVRVLAISEDWCPDCVFNVPISRDLRKHRAKHLCESCAVRSASPLGTAIAGAAAGAVCRHSSSLTMRTA
jgi:hypothetical protein